MAGAHDHGAVGRVPFWVHQAAELLLGILLLVQGARTGEHTAALVGLGGVLVLLAICSEGPLAAWPWIGRRLHRPLDFVAAAILAVSPLALSLDHAFGIVVVELAALAMVWLGLRTDWRPRAPARRRTAVAPPPEADPPAVRAPPPGPPLARTMGQMVGRARDQGPYRLGRLYRRARDAAHTSRDAPSKPPQEPPEPPPGPPEAP